MFEINYHTFEVKDYIGSVIEGGGWGGGRFGYLQTLQELSPYLVIFFTCSFNTFTIVETLLVE